MSSLVSPHGKDDQKLLHSIIPRVIWITPSPPRPRALQPARTAGPERRRAWSISPSPSRHH
uniref:Uncharacterized protein n=1 Tax=Arundo donax TaxID=35708 RepID=A0A0A8ZB23_ARUDO